MKRDNVPNTETVVIGDNVPNTETVLGTLSQNNDFGTMSLIPWTKKMSLIPNFVNLVLKVNTVLWFFFILVIRLYIY